MSKVPGTKLRSEYLFICDGIENAKALDSNDIKALKNIEIVADTAIVAATPGAKKENKVDIWKSDNNGVLRNIDQNFVSGAPVYLNPKIADKVGFFIPPKQSLQKAWAAAGTSWRKEVAAHFSSNFDQAKQLLRVKINSSQLLQPKESEGEKLKIYNKLQNKKKLHGFLLTRIKGICVIFTGELFDGAIINVRRADGSYVNGFDKDQNKTTIFTVTKLDPDNKDCYLYSTLIHTQPEEELPENQMYTFNVTATKSTSPTNWDKKLLNKRNEPFYTFQSHITFPMKTTAGEFDLVIGDPISVEESLITQFPSNYTHLTEMAKGTADWDPDYKKALLDMSKTERPDALQKTVDIIKFANSKIKFTKGLATADTSNGLGKFKLGLMIGKTVYGHSQNINEQVKRSIDLFFGITDITFNVTGFAKNYKYMSDVLGSAATTKAKLYYFANPENLNKHIEDLVEKHVKKNNLKELSKKELEKVAGKAINRQKKTSSMILDKFPEKATFLSKVGDGLKYIDAAIALYEIYGSATKLYGKNEELKKIKSYLDDYIKEYDKVYQDVIESCGVNAPCREAIQALEIQRQSHVIAEQHFDKATLDMCKKGLDVALAGAAFVPGLNAVAAVIAIAMAGYQLICTASELIEYACYDGEPGVDPDIKKMIKVINGMEKTNREFFPKLTPDQEKDGGLENTELQLRIRAEALSGLFSLINRATTRAKDHQDFFNRIDKYKVNAYIENFILSDQWTTPLNKSLPLTMDYIWLFSEGSNFAAADDYTKNMKKVAKRDAELDAKAANVLYSSINKVIANTALKDKKAATKMRAVLRNERADDGLMNDADKNNSLIDASRKLNINPFPNIGTNIMVGKEKANNVARSNFQQKFPIQRINTDKWEEMCYAMRSYFYEISKATVAYTCIYYREPNPNNGPLDKWKPLGLNREGSVYKDRLKKITDETLLDYECMYTKPQLCDIYQEEILSPYHEIRVLVVFEDDDPNNPKYANINYPISLQINRIDGSNITGPVYKGQSHTLTKKDLLPDELGYKDRIGYVFHPIYDLGTVKHGGIKPLHDNQLSFGSVYSAFARQNLFDNLYSIMTGASNELIQNTFLSATTAQESGLFNFMEYSLKLTIGNNKEYNDDVRVSPEPTTQTHGKDSPNDDKQVIKKYIEEYPTYFYLSIDPKRNKKAPSKSKAEELLLDYEFMRSRTKTFPPLDFFSKLKIRQSCPIVRFGGQAASGSKPNKFLPMHEKFRPDFSAFDLSTKKSKLKLTLTPPSFNTGNISLNIENFDWQTQVDVASMIFVTGDEIEKVIAKWEKYSANWKSGIRIDSKLVRKDLGGNWNEDGPPMTTKLHLLGKYKKVKLENMKPVGEIQSGHIEFEKNQQLEKHVALEELCNGCILASKRFLSNWGQTIRSWMYNHSNGYNFPTHEEIEVYVFTAIFTPKYCPPNSQQLINSVRPFGSDIADKSNFLAENQCYEYIVSGIQCPAKEVGLNLGNLQEFYRSGALSYLMRFPPPENGMFDPKLPWNKKKILSQKELEKWMEEDAELTGPKSMFLTPPE